MTKKRTLIKNLNLAEISGVTRPAQSAALSVLMKSEDAPLIEGITKYLSAADRAHSFNEFYADEENRRRVNHVSQEVWPLVDALRESLVSIYADESIADIDKQTRVAESVAQFVATSQHVLPRDTNLMKLFEENDNMSEELVTKAAGLEAQVVELTKKLADAEVINKMSAEERKYMSQLDEEAAEEFRAAAKEKRDQLMRKAAESDELFKSADGHEIRKSVVGEGVFAILKAQEDSIRATREQLAKTAERAQTVELTKVAEESYANLPGETLVKVGVLKGMASMDEASRSALEQMLKAGNDALAKGFQSYGVSGGKPQDIAKSSRLDGEVKKYRDADPNLTHAQAFAKALDANPDLYEG